uniref:Uncharacterized protein n=1 Tax=Saimiri boliviensis boliviensis TaxID=39432 RepID=A0A2K6S5U0_SAIBB
MSGKLLWSGDIMELQAPLEESESQKERQNSFMNIAVLDKGLWTCTSLIGLL